MPNLLQRWLIASACSLVLISAHPMGNFSVSHYSRIEARPDGLGIHYVLDLAEIPSLELMQKWNVKEGALLGALDRNTMRQAREWARNLVVESNGRRLSPSLDDARLTMSDGAGNMAVLRFDLWLTAAAEPGSTRFEDRNYAERAGWKEIVVVAADGVGFEGEQPSAPDRSHALTSYPTDLSIAPPQVLTTSFSWKLLPGVVSRVKPPTPAASGRKAESVSPLAEQAPAAETSSQKPDAASVPASTPANSVPAPAGIVVKGDFLSDLLGRRQIGWQLALFGVLAAFGLGAAHALSPGHGKTMVAAYLVGSRGTPKHAAILGATVTFTHTVSVFLLGFVTLFLSAYILPEKLYPVLGTISGLTIVWVGGTLLYKRVRRLLHLQHHLRHHHRDHDHHHHHGHDHDDHHAVHPGTELHAHEPVGAAVKAVSATPLVHTPHTHEHGHSHLPHDHHHHHGPEHHHDHDHHHGPGGHSHVPEGEITLSSLIALGVSGGLVPCPSGLVLLLSAIALGRTALGLVLLTAFSAGLAMVLTAIGIAVVYAKHWLPEPEKAANHAVLRYLPVASAAVVLVIGIFMTLAAVGWSPAARLVS